MCFESSTVTLPSATQTMSGTQLPAWVSAGGKALFEKSANLVEPKFDEQGNYISKFQYNQPKIASYQDISYDYNKDGTVNIADQNLATEAGNTANADAIAASLSGTTPLPMSKLTEEEQMAGDLLGILFLTTSQNLLVLLLSQQSYFLFQQQIRCLLLKPFL